MDAFHRQGLENWSENLLYSCTVVLMEPRNLRMGVFFGFVFLFVWLVFLLNELFFVTIKYICTFKVKKNPN